jgi:ATP-binding cassette subfamily C (CFTR/MRP) protein 1
LNRINKYLAANEIDDKSITHDKRKESILVRDGNFSWSEGEDPMLRNINIEIKHKELVAIVGRVGTGKSSLLSALLGNMFKITGKGKIQFSWNG